MMIKKTLGICSGFFGNPTIHRGHLEYLRAAKENCNDLLVIVNNDDQLILKGRPIIFSASDRLFMTKCVKFVDIAIISLEKDVLNVAKTIAEVVAFYRDQYDEFILFNSGDREPSTWSGPEKEVCDLLDVKTRFLELPKVDSSSNILERIKGA